MYVHFLTLLPFSVEGIFRDHEVSFGGKVNPKNHDRVEPTNSNEQLFTIAVPKGEIIFPQRSQVQQPVHLPDPDNNSMVCNGFNKEVFIALASIQKLKSM